jgi:hypothetical protein
VRVETSTRELAVAHSQSERLSSQRHERWMVARQKGANGFLLKARQLLHRSNLDPVSLMVNLT